MELQQFRSENCISYIINDPLSREAMVVDPSMDAMDAYRAHLAEKNLSLKSVLDLRTHTGHYSATHLFKKEFPSSSVCMSAHSTSKRSERKLREADEIALGKILFKIIETPGVCADAIAVAGEGVVLTGETLLIAACGKTVFPGADPGALFRSLQKLSALPGETLVFPGMDQTDLLCSAIGAELERNSELKLAETAFVTLKTKDLRVSIDAQSASCLNFNLEADPDYSKVARLPRNETRLQIPEGARASSISIEKFHTKLEKSSSHLGHPGHSAGSDTAFIDVREPWEFAAGHMPGVENIPLGQIPFAVQRLARFSRVYLSCQSGRRSERAANTLCYMGLKDAVNVSGGYKAWLDQGFPIEKSR